MFPGAWAGCPWFSVGFCTAGRWEEVTIQQEEGLVPRVWYPGQGELATLWRRGLYECSCQQSLAAAPASEGFIHHSLCL